MANEDIKELIAKNRLRYWEIAREYGLSDSNFSRLLRNPLSTENKHRILDIIEKLK